jgi:hypothetical protein
LLGEKKELQAKLATLEKTFEDLKVESPADLKA